MTDAELDAIEARAKAATKGPWKVDEMEMYIHGGDGFMVASNCPTADGWQVRGHGAEVSGHRQRGSQDANAAFIAASRSDVEVLVRELRAARKKLKAAEALAAEWRARADADDDRRSYVSDELDNCADELDVVLRGTE